MKIREATADEQATAMVVCTVAYNTAPTERDLEDELGLDVYVREDYITGGPGYTGPVWLIHWDGRPEYISVLTFGAGMVDFHDLGVKNDHPPRYTRIDTKSEIFRALIPAARNLLMDRAFDGFTEASQ